MRKLILFLLAGFSICTTAYAGVICTATDTTPCVKRSGVKWCWKPVESPDECHEEGSQSIGIAKDTGENPKKYCITVTQGGIKTKIYAESERWIPGEIVRDMFCSYDEE